MTRHGASGHVHNAGDAPVAESGGSGSGSGSGGGGRWAHVERRHVAAAAVGCAALAVVAIVDPSERTLLPPCPLRSLTGLDCPLCGATRATHALVHGDLLGALDFNALYVALLPLVALAVGWWLLRGRVAAPLQRASARWALVAAAMTFMVVRNLPAFTVLAS